MTRHQIGRSGVEVELVEGYRYGFNGKESDNEVKGEGNQIDYGMRVYDPRIGKFLSVDPLQKQYPELTPYQFTANSPIENIDLDGKEVYNYRLDLDDKGHKTGFVFLGKNIAGPIRWSIFDLFGMKIPAVDVYRNGEFTASYSFNTAGQGGLSTLKKFAYDEAYRNEFMSRELSDAQKQTQHSEEIGNTIAEGFKTAAVVNYAMSRTQTAPQQPSNNKTATQQTNKQVTAAQGGNKSAAKANTSEDRWANFDFEEYKTVYHKGTLSGGRVSLERSLATGTDPASVNGIRGGTLYTFKIPASRFNEWRSKGLVETYTDYDHQTGIKNEEIRFSPKVGSELNNYMVKDKKD